jgi:hypothetical protein
VKVEKEEFRRVPRVYRNKNGQALDDASSEFGGIFNAKFESTDEFIDFLAALGQRRSELREIIKSARSQFVRTREETLLSQRLRDLGKGMKEGRRLQKAESKQLHTDLIRLIESSDMEAKDKAGFLRTIKNIQTSEQMEKNLPEITQRIERLAEASEKKEIKRRIRALVERSKPSRAAGKPRGRFTPEIQELMNSLRPIVKLSKTKANAALSESIESVGDTIPSGDEAMKRRVLLIQADVASVHDAQETLSDLAAAVASGKVVHEIMVQGRRMRTDRVVQEVVRIVTGGKGLTPGVATFGLKSAEQRAKEAGFLAKASLALDQGLDFTVIAWNGLLDTLSLKDKSSQPGKSLLSQFGDVFQETVNERIGVHKANVRIREFTQKAYGIEQDQVIQKLRDNHKQQDLGTFTNTEGIKDKLVMSKDQAIKRWMEWQDPTLKETFTSENGMAWTPEMLAAVGLEGAPEKTGLLTEQDKAFGRAMLSFYQEYYQPINDVYKRLHFINLPHNPFYSPIRRAVDQPKSEGFGDLLQELQSRASLEGGSFISRVKNIRPLEQTSATAVIQEHIVAMERFKAWGEKIRDLNAVFKDPAVRQAITENYGKKRYDRVMRYLENYTRGGSDRSNRIRWLDRLRIKFTKSVLGVRPVILVKQLMSFPAFAETIPVAEFVSGLVDFATDPAGKTKILKESEWASLRGENIDRDIKTAIQEDRFKAFANSPTFTNRLMLNVRIGDMGAIVMGGWTVYRYARKQGKTHEQALDIFSRIANRTQQSGDIAEQSLFQQGGSIAQTMTMFASAPNQYLRIEIMAIRNYRAGRMSLGRLAKVLAIYHLILPMLFQLAADAFRWKPDEQLRSAIFGPLNGLFIIGDALDYVLRWGLRLAGFDELHQFPTDITPLESLGDDFATILRRIGDHVGGEFITDEEWWTALRALSGIGGALSGVPAKAGVDLVGAVNKVIEGDLRDGLPGLLGWTEFSLQD